MSDIYSTQATQVTPDSLSVRRKLAAALLGQASDTSPVKAWSQGAARLVQGLMGGYALNQTDKDQASARDQAINEFSGALGSGAPAAPAAPAPAPIGQTPADASLPRGYRNNNPLNIEAGSFTQGQPGYAGSDGRFAKFASLDHGTGAANKLLDTYQNKYGLNTPAGIVSRWAPATDGNNTQAYAGAIAKALGIGPNDPIPADKRQQLIAAMAQHENGAPLPAQPPAPPPQQPAQQPTINPQLIRALSNQFLPPAMGQIAAGQISQQLAPPELKMTKDMMGADIPNTWDARRGLWNGKPLQPGAAVPGAIPDNATPQEMTAAVDKQYPGAAARAEQIFNGEGGTPNARTNKIDGPAMQLLLKTHPDWSMNTWTAKNKMISGLSSTTPSSPGGRLQSLRNAFDHLANTSDTAIEKGNMDLGISPLSYVGNKLQSMTTSQKDLQARLEREAVTYGGERTKFLTGSEGSESERRAFVDSLGPTTAAPPQMAGTIEGEYTQLKSALVNQEQQVREQLGEDYLKKHPIVTPEVRHAMDRLEKNIDRLRGKGGAAAAGNVAQPQAAAPRAVNPKTGEQLELRNGQWVPVK